MAAVGLPTERCDRPAADVRDRRALPDLSFASCVDGPTTAPAT
ncbi:hypothetical protein [Streptomyces europaeiscabiei]